MIYMKNILFITKLKPLEKGNKGPNGLVWTLYDTLKKNDQYNIDLFYIDVLKEGKSKRWFFDQLDILGLRSYDINVNWNRYDYILVYPDTTILSVPKNVRSKVIVLAPDATSMARLSKWKSYANNRTSSLIKKLYQYIFYKRFISFERKYVPQVRSYLVVGRTDRRWIRFHLGKEYWDKVVFLPHPCIESALVDLYANHINISKHKRFVFSGDMSYSYVGENILGLKAGFDSIAPLKKLDILIVGGNNKWIYDLLSKSTYLNVTYLKWVEDYQDICRVGRDVHCIPLIAGAGTKNRVLTALANSLEIISTPKGVENISISRLSHVHVKKQMYSFAEQMYKTSLQSYTDKEILALIQEREKFRMEVKSAFLGTLYKTLTD